MFLNASRLDSLTPDILKSYSKLKLKTVSLGTLGKYNYSDLEEASGLYRDKFENTVIETLNSFKQSGIKVGVESANAYALPYVDVIWDMPIYSSGYDAYLTDVPFYQIVLHGLVTMTTPPVMQTIDSRVTFLKAVETGSELLYCGMYEQSSVLTGSRYDELYGTTYTLWEDHAIKDYKAIMPLLDKVYDQAIIDHTELSDGVIMTTFENGVRVVVNYNNYEVKGPEGQNCKAMNFIVC
jgi:hypothetical protein